MYNRFIITVGLAAAAVTLAMQAQAKAEAIWIGAGVGHVGWGAAAPPMRQTWDYGVPGHQRPVVIETAYGLPAAGPGRHRVCAWQERYDAQENYAGSRRICWIEAR